MQVLICLNCHSDMETDENVYTCPDCGAKVEQLTLFTEETTITNVEGESMVKVHKCVECGVIIPIYQKYLCEKCYEEMLNHKIKKGE